MLAIDLTTSNVVPVALAYGFGSAFLPFLNAELFVAAAVAALANGWWWPVLALSMGQTVGKCLMFLGARHGASWLERRRRRQEGGPARELTGWRLRVALWGRLMLELLDRPVQSFLVVLAAATIGIPPLAIVSVVAGTRKTPFAVFVTACTIGRAGRFLALAWPIAAATH